MTDKKLLELAAKAADVGILWWSKDGKKLFTRNGGEQKPWNPLEHDGDALRLAVGLGFNVEYCPRWKGTRVISNPDNGLAKEHWSVDQELDKYAATRRAIVCAAAEIGRRMK